MELAPRFCRSCGSRILVKNVCHNCNNDPLKGDNYCYDCGALTPNADSCLKCGAKYKTNSPVKLVLIVGSLLIISIAVAGYFISRKDITTASDNTTVTDTIAQVTNSQEIPLAKEPVINNPVDTSALLITKTSDTLLVKPVEQDTIKKTEPDIFTPQERKTYKSRCSYFTKNQRGRVLFFVAGTSGYVKVNHNIIELKRKRKGVDVAVFGSTEYEVTLTIDGLSGSAREWLASCTLVIKDLILNSTVRHKVYSPCIEL